MRAIVLLLLSVVATPVEARQVAPAPPTPAQLPSIKLPPEIDRVLRDYESAWRARDAAGLAKVFTSDGFVLQNGRPPVRGTAAIEQAYTGRGGPLQLRAFHYEVADTVGFIIGGYSGAVGEQDAGKFVLAIRRTKTGPWRIVADIDNGNQPPRRPPPS